MKSRLIGFWIRGRSFGTLTAQLRFWIVKEFVNKLFGNKSVTTIYKIGRTKRIIALTTTVFLSIPSLAIAQTIPAANPSPAFDNSQIIPYLLDNPNENSLVKVRCLSTDRHQVNRKRQMIRERLLQPTVGDRNYTVTIEVEGSCRNLKVHVQNDSDFSDVPVYHPYSNNNSTDFDDSWLREGSGWYWLLHRR
ncbi:MAG: hypothetical protein V7K47_17415 [Nostoc sp.]